jgi:hypothetical protein
MKTPININYCATVVEITKVIPIEKADNIQAAIILGNSVVVSKDITIGTKGIFFPLECQITTEFLSKHNLFRESSNNLNTEIKGFFEANGRVRAVNLRSQKSEGFFIPVKNLHIDYVSILALPVGTDFDFLHDECICRKYVTISKERKDTSTAKKTKVVNQFSRLVDNQFSLHIDTIQAKKNFHLISPNDIISITDKWHGTSAIFANILTNKELKWYEKVLLKLGVNVESVEYGNIYSSRKVVKNKYVNKDVTPGFYKTDIWEIVNNDIKDLIPKGITLYGEIVGYIPGASKAIQGGYTYNCQPNTYKFLVYRITNTNQDGIVTEYLWKQIKQFCTKFGVENVKEFYYGYAKDLYPNVTLDDNWNDTVLSLLKDDYNLEKECKYNKGMPAEGIVIRKDSLYKCEPMKLKSFSFLKHETMLLDNGESDIESDQEAD